MKYIGDSYIVRLIKGSVYDVIEREDDDYRIIDETGDDGTLPQGYLFPIDEFEIVEQ